MLGLDKQSFQLPVTEEKLRLLEKRARERERMEDRSGELIP